MKYFFILCLAVLFSCDTPKIVIQSNCTKPTKELFTTLSHILIQDGFEIKTSNYDLGFLTASKGEKGNSLYYTISSWEFTVVNNQLMAIPKEITQAATKYITDNYANTYYFNNYKWYWNIRNKLGSFCGDSIKFINISN